MLDEVGEIRLIGQEGTTDRADAAIIEVKGNKKARYLASSDRKILYRRSNRKTWVRVREAKKEE